ncbi:MAG: hypothetical protein K2H56_02370 [Malacoplasma sp.]|nr:hypothetical protein [Malacoplasma sp.]MDE5774805.1 hypothetical protein [Malacoplasma sp.]
MKKSSLFALFKKQKKLAILGTIGIASVTSIFSGLAFLNQNSGNLKNVNSNFNALSTTTQQTQSVANFNVNSSQEPLNKKANQVLNSDLENVLTPSSAITSWSVVILPVNEQNINKGYVNFLIYQTYYDGSKNVTTFADATKSTAGNTGSTNYKTDDNINQTILNNYKGDATSSPTANNVFSTRKINNLNGWITAEKYEFVWNSEDSIKEYVLNSTSTNLSPEDVWNNFFNKNNLPPLQDDGNQTNEPYTKITITVVDANGTNTNNNIGLYKVEIVFANTSKSDWLSNNFPEESQGGSTSSNTEKKDVTITKYIGGFLGADGTRKTIEVNMEQNFRSWIISDTSLFNGVSQDNQQVSTLTPSQFVSPLGGTSSLISLFDSGIGLKESATSTESKPILTYSYSDQSFRFYNSSVTGIGTVSDGITGGILQEIKNNNSSLMITNIEPIPNDQDGSLQLIITYNEFSIFTGHIVSATYEASLPAATFAINENQTNNLILSWKTADVLSSYGFTASSDVVNEFNKNKYTGDPSSTNKDETKVNSEFVRLFTNQFINTTSSINSMNRKATILYGTPSTTSPMEPVSESNTSYNETTGNYEPSSGIDNKTITVRLEFENWNGLGEPKVFQQSFTLPYYKYENSSDVLSITWKTNDAVITENPSFPNTIPSSVAYNLVTSAATSPYTSFITSVIGENESNLSINLLPDDINGTLTIFLSKKTDNTTNPNNYIYSQFFTGFAKSQSTTGVVSFSWLPQDEVSSDLLSIPLNRITKQDVVDYYLSNIGMFQDGTLSLNNIQITPILSDSSLLVQVNVPIFNQEDENINNRVFATRITGFISNYFENDTRFDPPKNLTAVISVSVATTISVTLGVVLLSLLLRRARIRNFKDYHNGLLEKDKNKKNIVDKKELNLNKKKKI